MFWGTQPSTSKESHQTIFAVLLLFCCCPGLPLPRIAFVARARCGVGSGGLCCLLSLWCWAGWPLLFALSLVLGRVASAAFSLSGVGPGGRCCSLSLWCWPWWPQLLALFLCWLEWPQLLAVVLVLARVSSVLSRSGAATSKSTFSLLRAASLPRFTTIRTATSPLTAAAVT